LEGGFPSRLLDGEGLDQGQTFVGSGQAGLPVTEYSAHMEQDLPSEESTAPLARIEEEIEFWRGFVRQKEADGDLQMVLLGNRALTNALKRKAAYRSSTAKVLTRFDRQ